MARTLMEPRWTHVAVPVSDLDRSIEFYTALTPLVVVAHHEDENGRGAWLSNDKQVETPFVLVLSQLIPEVAENFDIKPGVPTRTLGPFAHIGIDGDHRHPAGVEDGARGQPPAGTPPFWKVSTVWTTSLRPRTTGLLSVMRSSQALVLWRRPCGSWPMLGAPPNPASRPMVTRDPSPFSDERL